MRTLRPILLALTAVAALSVAYPAKANLITNPGFETGDFTGWTVSGLVLGGVGGTFNGQAPHSGNFQATLGTASSGSISQSVATTPSATYTIDFFAAANNGSIQPNFTLTVNFGGAVFSHLFNSASGYAEYTFNATASGASTALNFTNTGVGFLLLDDISVTPTTVPDGGTTVSLLGCALVGLAGLRRKLGC
jgi:VPDSG-CTERM motif/Protein of unknown function (DUF642)